MPLRCDVMTPDPGEILDHIESKLTLVNCRTNLRSASPAENGLNKSQGINNTSGRKNVRKLRNRFYVRIAKQRITHSFGPFDTFEEACAVQEREIARLHGEFARVE